MKRVSNLFSPDHRRPALSPLHSPSSRPPSQQGEKPSQWADRHNTDYTAGYGDDAEHHFQPHYQKHEQQWLTANGRSPPSPIPGTSGRPKAPERRLTADSRESNDMRSSQPSWTQVGSTLVFPSHAGTSILNNGTHTPAVSRPSSAHSFVSAHSFALNGKSVTPRLTTPSDDRSLERGELHKTLKSIEVLLIALDEYRSLQAQLVKVEKRLSLGSTELAKNKTIERNPSSALELAATSFLAQHETGTRFVKLIQKEYEALNDTCAKYFKTIAKEEKALDDFAAVTEDKIKKAQFAYEKAARKGSSNPRATADAHDRYIGTISNLANETNAARQAHGTAMATKSHGISLRVASTLGGIAESSFRSHCDAVRASGPTIGPLAATLNFCVGEAMPVVQPMPLAEDEAGRAMQMASAEASTTRYDDGVTAQRREFGEPNNLEQLQPAWDQTEKVEAARNVSFDTRVTRLDGAVYSMPHSQQPQDRHGLIAETNAWSSNGPLSQEGCRPSPPDEQQRSRGEMKLDGNQPSDSASEIWPSVATALSPRNSTAVEKVQRNGHGEQVPSRSSLTPSPYHDPVNHLPRPPRQTLPLKIERRSSSSIWERKREEEERREREETLERRAKEAEGRLKLLERTMAQGVSGGGDGGSDDDKGVSPLMQQRQRQDEQEDPMSQQEQTHVFSPDLSIVSPRGGIDLHPDSQDYFAHRPSDSHPIQGEPTGGIDGLDRIDGETTISRTLSSATDASERSFVARMRARYQMEKEQEREGIRRSTEASKSVGSSQLTSPSVLQRVGREREDSLSKLPRAGLKTMMNPTTRTTARRTTDTPPLLSKRPAISSTVTHSSSPRIAHAADRTQVQGDVRRRGYETVAAVNGGHRWEDES